MLTSDELLPHALCLGIKNQFKGANSIILIRRLPLIGTRYRYIGLIPQSSHVIVT